MRGAEQPAQVRWTRPFLQPLQPLSYDAARKTFLDIAGELHDSINVEKILHLTDNMPLAVDLVAHLVDSEGCATVLSRWDTERTSVVSDGFDQRSNLDMSISLSLSSPRVASVSGTKDLLSLLSMLPDGLSDIELKDSNLPIDNILECKATLLRTSLAYCTSQKRLRVLVPIREHMQRYHPAQPDIVEPLFHKYRQLLELYHKHQGTMLSEIVPQIKLHFSNIQSLLSFRILQVQLDHSQTIYCAIDFRRFSFATGAGIMTTFMDLISILPKPVDHRLEVCFISEYIAVKPIKSSILGAEVLIEQALEHFPHFSDLYIKCQFYNEVASYYFHHNNFTLALEFHEKAVSLSVSGGQTSQQSLGLALKGLAVTKWYLGDYLAGQALASESQRAAQLSADLRSEANALSIEAICLTELGSFPKAIAQLQRAQSLLTLCGMAGGVTEQNVMNNMAEIYKFKSQYIQARDIQTRLLSCTVDTYRSALSILNMAEIDISLNTPIQDVQKNIDTARSLWKELEYSPGITMCDVVQAHLYLREGNMSAAKQGFERALQSIWGKDSELTTYCLEKLGDINRWSSISWTYIWPIVLLAYAWKTKQQPAIYKGLQFLGDIFLLKGDRTTAISLLTVALDAFTYMDIYRSRAECMLQLGNISQMNGDFGKAEELWKMAQPLFEYASQEKKVVLIDEKLLSIQPDLHKLQLLTAGLQQYEDEVIDQDLVTGTEAQDRVVPIH
ncbi:hypothetical protein GGX14DRAFT_654265 [Mycena pura]|uniref:Uncharacterized protein n=1 Tax=Mycena pura TaxID=153505 RepID=A0AAD6V4N4_9AGAR|nr:hypothetical protein GGX14DRAFT_654265 [Mycena pura]